MYSKTFLLFVLACRCVLSVPFSDQLILRSKNPSAKTHASIPTSWRSLEEDNSQVSPEDFDEDSVTSKGRKSVPNQVVPAQRLSVPNGAARSRSERGAAAARPAASSEGKPKETLRIGGIPSVFLPAPNGVPLPPEATTTAPRRPAPTHPKPSVQDMQGFVTMPGLPHYYKYIGKAENWFVAKRTCEDQGAYLAIPNDEVEAHALVYLMKLGMLTQRNTAAVRSNHMHVGISDNEEEGVWRTVKGDLMEDTAMVKWSRNQPAKDNTLENCVQMYDDLEYVDYYCTGRLSFICEKEINQ